jgi:hypothetical protein
MLPRYWSPAPKAADTTSATTTTTTRRLPRRYDLK